MCIEIVNKVGYAFYSFVTTSLQNQHFSTLTRKTHIRQQPQDHYLLVFYAFLLQKNMHYLKTFLKLTVRSMVDNDS